MSEDESAARDIDWSTAEVEDGNLTVRLTGEASSKWSERLSYVLDMLGRRGGVSVEVAEDQITVREVAPGSEPEVRHLLESAVLQVNSDVAPERDESDEPDEGDEGEEREEQDERSSRDQEMTDAFRDFGSDRPQDSG